MRLRKWVCLLFLGISFLSVMTPAAEPTAGTAFVLRIEGAIGPAAASDDPEERIDRLEAAVHDATFANEAKMRLLLRATLDRWLNAEDTDDAVPLRQNRRSGWIDAALEPIRKKLEPEAYDRLSAALSMVIGIESMITFRDVLNMTPEEARAVKSWTVKALVRAAMADALKEPAAAQIHSG